MSDKKKSVGIQFLSRDGKGEIVAILQVRGKWNAEKNSPESWPGACQVTAHGKLEEGEDFTQALLREIREELGNDIAAIVKKLSDAGSLVELVNDDSPEKQTITYGVIVAEDVLKIMIAREKSDSFGGFRLIRAGETGKIVDIQKFEKTLGVTDKTVIAMFSDEKKAVKMAFEKLI